MSTREYTSEERYKIIRYLIDNKKFSCLKGFAVWKEIEKAKVINRSWQSMRTQFKGKIIDVLHLFNISETDRQNILSGWNRKTIAKKTPYNVAGSHVGKRRFSFSSDSDSDTTVCTLNKIRSETRINRSISAEASTSTSPDLLAQGSSLHEIEVTSSNNPNCNSNKSDRTDIVVLDDDSDESTIDANSGPFSLEEDNEIINFFKKNQQCLYNIYEEDTYQIFRAMHSSNRSCEALKNRFVDHILPNLYEYKCLTYNEMVQFYDKTEIDVPAQLQSEVDEIVLKHTIQSATHHDSCTNTIPRKILTTDDTVQVLDPTGASENFNIYTIDLEKNQPEEDNENSVIKEKSNSKVSDSMASIVPSTPVIPTVPEQNSPPCTSDNNNNTDVFNERKEKQLSFDMFKNQVDKKHASTQTSATHDINSSDDVHERSSVLSLQSTVEFCCPGEEEHEPIVSNSTDTNLTNPLLTEFMTSDESTRNFISVQSTNTTSDSDRLSSLPDVTSEMDSENEQINNSSDSQMSENSDTFYSACSS